MKIILGSQSEGRKRILKEMGYEFEVMPSNIDEKAIRFDDPVKLTLALANAKADALLKKIKESAILITSDQVVVCNGKILEKPTSAKEAREYLNMYNAYSAKTITSVVVANTATGARVSGIDIAKIWFRSIPEDIINKYIATKDPFLHAGAFDCTHNLMAFYVDRIEGELESVVGLPKSLTEKLIKSVK